MARTKGNKTKKNSNPNGVPPLGSYDPGLEAQRRASARGLKDLKFDTRTANQRARADQATKTGLLTTDYTQHTADTHRDFERDMYDLSLSAQRGTEDYNRSLDALTRRYTTLGDTQAQQQAAAGVDRGGAGAAAAEARTANMSFERQPIDIGYGRQQADIGLRTGRLGEDTSTALGRLGLDYGNKMGALGTDFTRGLTDRHTKLSRAKREQIAYNADVTQQEYFQAHQYDPKIKFPTPAGASGKPKPPHLTANMFHSSVGLAPPRKRGRRG